MKRIANTAALVMFLIAPSSLLAMDISLDQATDTGCKGVLSTSSTALPGDCIHYTAQVNNSSKQDANNVQIALLIPIYTTLYSQPVIKDERKGLTREDDIKVDILQEYGYETGRIILTLPVLAGDNKDSVSVEYTVRVKD